MFDVELHKSAEDLLARCRDSGKMIATAESCTGGLIVGLLTEIAGSSDVVDRGFVTYSNAAKQSMLGVPEKILAENGAVSAETAAAMAKGALQRSKAEIAVAVTGIAGPGGGTPEKPVGLVHLCCAATDGSLSARECCFGDIGRDAVRRETIRVALGLIDEHLG